MHDIANYLLGSIIYCSADMTEHALELLQRALGSVLQTLRAEKDVSTISCNE